MERARSASVKISSLFQPTFVRTFKDDDNFAHSGANPAESSTKAVNVENVKGEIIILDEDIPFRNLSSANADELRLT